jgi:site-specific recombinase XerD
MKKNIIISKQHDVIRYTHWLSNEISLEQLKVITQNQYSQNSLLAMRKDWLTFCEYTKAHNHTPLPTSVANVKLFIHDISRKRKFSTVKRYVVTISNIHQMLGYPDPTLSKEIVLLLNYLKREKQGDERQTTVFSKTHLEQITAHLINRPDAVSCRDLAIYSLMFECALKRSELRDLTIDQCSTANIENQAGETVSVILSSVSYQLSPATSTALIRWFTVLNQSEGPVFRSIDRHNNIRAEPMNDSSIFRILKKASTLLGLPDHLSFSGQSARVGAVSELHQQGYSVKDIQEFGRWNSPVMPHQYLGNSSQAEEGKRIFKTFNKID